MQQEDRTIRMLQAREDGYRYQESISDKEAEALDAQRHEYFSDWTPQEQERFKSEQSAMWAQIPEHLRAKAERMARGH
jgi:hypothetical protein